MIDKKQRAPNKSLVWRKVDESVYLEVCTKNPTHLIKASGEAYVQTVIHK